jgi:hypothetical protein
MIRSSPDEMRARIATEAPIKASIDDMSLSVAWQCEVRLSGVRLRHV